MKDKLGLSAESIERARELAARIAAPVLALWKVTPR